MCLYIVFFVIKKPFENISTRRRKIKIVVLRHVLQNLLSSIIGRTDCPLWDVIIQDPLITAFINCYSNDI